MDIARFWAARNGPEEDSEIFVSNDGHVEGFIGPGDASISCGSSDESSGDESNDADHVEGDENDSDVYESTYVYWRRRLGDDVALFFDAYDRALSSK